MAFSSSLLFSSFFLLLFLLSPAANAAADRCTAPPDPSSSDISLFHMYGASCSPSSSPATGSTSSNTNTATWFDMVMGMAGKDPARLAFLASLVAPPSKPTAVPIASGQQLIQTANYVLRAKLGTPGQPLYLAFDTSADVAWVPCAGCSGCAPTSALFTSSASSTYSSLGCAAAQCPLVKGLPCAAASLSPPCLFNQSYGGADSFAATLARDALRLADDVVPDYAFGCVTAVAGGGATIMPKQGLLGLGRGAMSLLSQAGSIYGGVFSYCLPSFRSYYLSGSLRLGPAGQPKAIRTTPLLRNPHRPSLYFVNLTGVSVGKTPLRVPPELLAFDPDTGAGTVVDSGTVISRFVAPLYAALRDEFRRQVGSAEYTSLGAFDTCFPTPTEAPTPAVTLHLQGPLDLVLPAENTLIHSSATPLACLAMGAAAPPGNVNSVLNVIANLQQQNHRVLVDTVAARVGFARELCS